MNSCTHCGNETFSRNTKYCSNSCQADFQYMLYISKWKNGLVDGGRGINTRNVSRHLRRYLFEKFANACSLCGWSETNLLGAVPLEIDHIDGNAENNTENNLRLICPNCHSLTPNYKNFNKSSSRKWRKLKYIKN